MPRGVGIATMVRPALHLAQRQGGGVLDRLSYGERVWGGRFVIGITRGVVTGGGKRYSGGSTKRGVGRGGMMSFGRGGVQPLSLAGWSSRSPQRHLFQLRTISIGRIAGQSLRFFRLPIGLASLFAGAMTYATYKLEQLGQGLGGLWADMATRVDDLATHFQRYAGQFGDRASEWAQEASGWADILGQRLNTSTAKTQQGFNDWWAAVKERLQTGDDTGGGGEGGSNGPPLATAATAASVATLKTKGEEKDSETNRPSDNTPLMLLTRKLIEIRNILLELDDQSASSETLPGPSRSLRLPSIVVIGSQSSGKSSVLEAIVGHEFLPKGDNMVTRRPIELTLIHETGSGAEYGIFPQLNGVKMESFSDIQRTLLEQNLQVSDSDCVSSDPIQLSIVSPNVPDLTLIDLPGYIQISSLDQPEELKTKIEDLCQTYIQEPNLILAVCSADVDLANSPALRASRKVDPLGLRTMGVITKMDLVEPAKGIAILTNKKYPLHLGYVGVVSKVTEGMKADGRNMTELVIQQEERYFNAYPEYQSRPSEESQLLSTKSSSSPKVNVGIARLRKKLMLVLEENMSRSLSGIADNVARELEEARYQFKVQYNDRSMTAESYVAETMEQLKSSFKQLAQGFGKAQIREMLKQAFDQQVMDILAAMYWIDPKLTELSSEKKTQQTDPHWEHRLEASTSALTKSGVGRKSTQIVVEALRNQIESLTQGDPFNYHPETSARIQNAALEILTSRFHQAADQVENCVKPYKYQVDIERHEWDASLKESEKLLKNEIELCEKSLTGLKALIGQRKLNSAMKYVGELEEKIKARRSGGAGSFADDQDDLLRPTFNPQLLQKAQEALLTQNRLSILKSRLGVIRSKHCRVFKLDQDPASAAKGFESSTLSPKHHPQSVLCPEIFLNAIEDKLASTAVMFIHLELLSEFFYHFPRQIETQMLFDSDKTQMINFARQNPRVKRHLELQERKDKLELVMQKLEALAPDQLHHRPATGSRLFSFFS